MWFLCILLLLGGCCKPRKQFSTKKQFDELRYTTQTNLIDTYLHTKSYGALLGVEEHEFVKLSRDEAVRFALINNPLLQADFQKLGIAKADLVQAGLFRNPSINSLFRIRTDSPGDPNVEIDAPVLDLADFWQVPLKKRVSQDELEIITKEILESILTIYADTKIAYDTCLFAYEKYALMSNVIEIAQELYEWIQYRYQFGFETALDVHLANVRLLNFISDRTLYEAEVKNAFIHLTMLIGSKISAEQFSLTDDLRHQDRGIPEVYTLNERALEVNPDVQMQHLKVRQARHRISLERSKALKSMKLAASFKLDFESQRGPGPGLSFEVPFFDWNQAQIQAAKVDLNQQEKLLLAIQRAVTQQVNMHYNLYEASFKQIDIHHKALLALKEGLDFADYYEHRMMFQHGTILDVYIRYYLESIAYIKNLYNTHVHLYRLEKAIGHSVKGAYEVTVIEPLT